MTRYDRRLRILAACLSALAGYVDAIGFIELGGFFVSFMSGNSTRLAVGLVGDWGNSATAAWLVGCFVLGVMLGSLVGHLAKARRRPAVLVLVALLLGGAAAAPMAGAVQAAILLTVLAMGAENAVFAQDGDVQIGLTYMTGTLVKLGMRLTSALLGGERFGWAPYLLLWIGLVLGAVAGAALHPRLGLDALWIAAGAALIMAAAAARLDAGSGTKA